MVSVNTGVNATPLHIVIATAQEATGLDPLWLLLWAGVGAVGLSVGVCALIDRVMTEGPW